LGSSSTFTESGTQITAYASPGATLWAKDEGAGEQGIGIASDPTGDNEIWGSTFIQLKSLAGLPTLNVSFGSTTDGEIANIYYSTTLGVLGTLIGSVSSNTSFNIASAYQTGYIGVAAGGSTASGVPNVLLGGATVNTPSAPDGGSTIALLGAALTAAGLLRRKFVA
jgi:hypothetical protein